MFQHPERVASNYESISADRFVEINELCSYAGLILETIPSWSAASREEFFEENNLWSLEVESVVTLTIQYYRAVSSLTLQNLGQPAAALARSIHEACFRFKYLVENEQELKDWVEWQIAQDYKLVSDTLQHDPSFDDETRNSLNQKLKVWEYLLGGPPKGHRDSWRNTSEIFGHLSSDLPDGREKRLRRTLIGFFSEYVHPRRTVDPPVGFTLATVQFCVLLTLRRAMELCCEKELLPLEARDRARQIVTECEELLISGV